MIDVLIHSAKKVFTKVALSMISDRFLEWAFFDIADRIVKSTATPHDDEWLEKIKEGYKNE